MLDEVMELNKLAIEERLFEGGEEDYKDNLRTKDYSYESGDIGFTVRETIEACSWTCR
jgi:hypothetical protein